MAWVSERKDVLSALFGFAALGAYGAYVKAPSVGRYLAVAGAQLVRRELAAAVAGIRDTAIWNALGKQKLPEGVSHS